jgi:single-strand DNA-binding protein
LNSITIVGRVTREPEMKYTESGKAICKFSIAVDQPGKKRGDTDKTDFFDVEVWERKAEFAGEWVKKGQHVAVTGRHESRKHEGKTYWTVKANDLNPFLGGGKTEAASPTPEEMPF